MLRSHNQYVRVYMNDIVMFSNSVKEHVIHLQAIFELFVSLQICLSLKKTFLEYSFVTLLRQKENDLRLVTTTEKLEVIIKLRFSATLNELKIYLDFIK